MKACKGRTATAPFVLVLSTSGDERSTSRPGRFNSEKEPRHTLNRRLGGPQGWSGRLGKEKDLLLQPGLEIRTGQPSRALPLLFTRNPTVAVRAVDVRNCCANKRPYTSLKRLVARNKAYLQEQQRTAACLYVMSSTNLSVFTHNCY